MHRPDPKNLTPGVIDGYALNAFKLGACGALAIAMHDATGWPIYAVTDAHNVFEDGTAGGGSAMHWAVMRPDGMLIDIDGAHTAQEFVEEYKWDAAAAAAVGRSTRADAVEWYVEAQGEPVPIALAATFVDAVVATAADAVERPGPRP